MRRRGTLALAVAALARPALAQARPIRLIVAFGAGGIADLVARIFAEGFARTLGQPVVVENRGGAGGNIAAEVVLHAAPDGLTLLVAPSSLLAVNRIIYRNLAFDPARELEPLGLLGATPHILVAHPRVAADWAGLRMAAAARPEALSWGTAGAGSSPHMTLLLLQSLTETRWLPVHFRSGAASVQAVLAGDVSATAESTPVVIGHIRAGTLRAHCVAAPERLALLPEVPTGAELGLAGFENGSIAGLAAPRGLPEAVRTRLAAATAAALALPEVDGRLRAQGTVPRPGDGAAFAALIAHEQARWRPLLVGISAE